MKKPDSDALLALVRRAANEIIDAADRADVLNHLAGGLVALKRTADAKQVCNEAERLLVRGADADMRLAPVRARLWEQRAALGENAAAEAELRKLSAALTATPRSEKDRLMIPGGDIFRAGFPLGKERQELESITNFAPRPDDILAAVAMAQAHLPDAEGVWRTLKAIESRFATHAPVSELVRTFYRTGHSREGKETLERARPYYGTRDFDLAAIAQLQVEGGDLMGAAATAATMCTDERVRYRLEIQLAIAEARQKRGDNARAASEAREVLLSAEKLQKTQAGMIDLPWFRSHLRERVAFLLYCAGFPDEARALWKHSNPRNNDFQQLALANELAALGALPEAEAIWSVLERKGNPNILLPLALSRTHLAGGSAPAEKIEEARKGCRGVIRELQVLALTCAENRFFAEAEQVIQTIVDKDERIEALRRIALIAADSLAV